MKKFVKVAVISLSVAAALWLTECPQNPSTSSHNKDAKAVELIKFNLKDAKALGSVFKTASISPNASIRAAEKEEDADLLKYDKNGEPSSVMEDVDSEQTIDYSTLNSVVEVKKNPYSNIPEAAKGVYVLFSNWNNEIKYSDGTAAPVLGQLIYSKADGSLVDVSGIHKVFTNNAEYKGYDYLEFANDGKAYFVTWTSTLYSANSDKPAKQTIWCFNPEDSSVKEIDLGISTKYYSIDDFRINDDGSWMFVSTSENLETYNDELGIRHLYAVPVANPANKIDLYKQATDEKSKDYTISKITYDSTTKMMYAAVGGPNYLTNAKRFYLWDNGYSASNVTFYEPAYLSLLTTWYGVYKYDMNMADDAVFDQIAKNFKNYCDLNHSDYNPAEGSSDDIEINLSWFADKPEYADIYSADAIDGEAVKILFDNLYPNGFNKGDEYLNVMDYSSAFKKFIDDYHSEFPIDKICFLKDSDGNATAESAFAQNETMYSTGLANFVTELVSTKNGCWAWREYVWSATGYYSDIIQVTDADGNFTCTLPDAFNGIRGYSYPFTYSRSEDDPWYKNPFSVSEDGLALISEDRKEIYYFDGSDLKKLLDGKDIVSSIDYVYTVTLDDDILYFTAKGTNGNWINDGINLSDGSIFELKTTDLLSSIVGM